ncbi:MAG: tetratricopeptide repeat protein [Pseudomonadota bacterium]
MKRYVERSFLTLLFASILVVFPTNLNAGPHPFTPTSIQEVMSRVVSIATHESLFGTTINVLGNGKIPTYVTETQDLPPKIVVDILCTAESLETITVASEHSNLKGLRVGHHPQKIRMVLDLKAIDIPTFAIKSVGNELTIFLKSRKIMGEKEDDFSEDQSDATGNDLAVLKPLEDIKSSNQDPAMSTQPKDIKTDENQKNTELLSIQNSAAKEFGSVSLATAGRGIQQSEQDTKQVVQVRGNTGVAGLKEVFYGSNLTQIVPDDGRNDTALLIESLNAYGAQNWSGAIENLTLLIKTYPQGRYSEKACFLLAKANEQLYSTSISDHFSEIKKYYEDAIYRFPASEYGPQAFLGIGNLLFKTGNYYEALAYYNLVIKKAPGSILAAKALMQKADIMLQNKRQEEAMSISAVLEDSVSGFPDMPVKTEAKLLRAKILYEMNRFRESLDIFSELQTASSENSLQYPAITLYLGYNYYQLQDNQRSRENLLKFYNSYPDREMNHLILPQIGDTYRNEGRHKDAVKFYQLVLKRYPEKEGAAISKIRLAEEQEEQAVASARGIAPPVNILDEDLDREGAAISKIRLAEEQAVASVMGIAPRINILDEDLALAAEFYKEIINKPVDKKNENPLTQLALLKLSIIYQKEKEYEKSLKHLKLLFEKYPQTSLRKEGLQALTGTIDGFFKEELKAKKYGSIINFYVSEKELIYELNAPEVFITVARAFIHQKFEDMGTEMFEMADPMLSDEEKPPDLLFLLGRYFYKQEKLEIALERISLFIDRYPSDKNVPSAYRLKGSILLKLKKYPQAAEMFSAALRYPADKCEKLSILIDRAKALAESNPGKEALEATKEADGIKSACISTDYSIYQEIGDLYLNLGDTQRAIDLFNQAIVIAKEKADKISLMLKVAQGYRLLDKKEEFLALYDKISKLNDPFWSNLAKEKLEEMNFNWEMEKMKVEWKRGEKI